MSDRASPPRLAVRLLAWRLPAEVAEALSGDLEQEYSERMADGRGRLGVDVWFWSQVLTLQAGALRRAAKRLRAVRGSGETFEPSRPGSGSPRRASESNRPHLGGGGRWGGAGVSWLDVKLGLRMLVKYPGMTCVAIFALAIAIPAGLGPMHVVNAALALLPVDEGDRILVLRNLDVAASRARLTSSEDFVLWREELTSFEAIGAATIRALYNVISEDGRAAPVQSAQVTASTFDILRVRPLLGRTLIPADEVIGAPAVVVIGYDLWQSRLEDDPDVVGRVIRIGRVPHTVVGVMPEGFLFPFRDHLWLPLPDHGLAEESGTEATRLVFGRLSDGASAEEAQAELTTVGRRMAMEFPDTHARLQPEVVPFAIGFFGLPKAGLRAQPEMYLVQVLAFLVLVVACANVGMLIFTRTAARAGELSVRAALGASRARVISQLFTEALVFAVLAAGAGLLLGDWLAGRFD